MLGALAVLGVVQAECSRKIERARRIVDDRAPHINLTSAWTFAGVLLIPPELTAALVAVLYAHLARRSWRHLSVTPTYRTVSNGCRATLCCYASYQVLTWSGVGDIHVALQRGWASVGGIASAILIYFLIAAAIAIPGLKPADHTLSELFGGWVDNLLEVLTLLTAVVVALILVTPLPWAVVAVVGLLVFAHYAVLDRQLAQLGETDHTTGLANSKGWHRLAIATLDQAQHDHRIGALLMIKVDDFNDLSNGYRRLAGDSVLAAIAKTVSANVGDHDVIGRLTGAEFVALLRDTTQDQAMQVAERIRTEVAWLRVPVLTVHERTEVIVGMSVSIGVAPYPELGVAIHKLLTAADTALDLAKHYGGRRNQVRLATSA
jgi:diguanylate cyclase (GGDEF)-like protein